MGGLPGGTAYAPPGCAAAAKADDFHNSDPIDSMKSATSQASFEHYLFLQPSGPSATVALKKLDGSLSMGATSEFTPDQLDTLQSSNVCLGGSSSVSANPTWSNYSAGWLFRKIVH